jgi:polyisoprenoid-binding protein YceI
VATGTVRRSDYGIDRWSFAIVDKIRFSLRLRTREPGEGSPG